MNYFATALVGVALFAATPSAALPGGPSFVNTIPRAGSVCTFGSNRDGAIGLPIGGGPDRPGVTGNEIRNIYRVFYTSSTANGSVTGLAGWLAQSFDGQTSFRPADSLSIGNYSILVSVFDVNRLPLKTWVTRMVNQLKLPVDVDSLHLENAATAISPCFAQPWDGKLGN
jgi:hypothetical protein